MVRELHISRPAREKYRFDDSLFSIAGRVLVPNFHAARRLAQAMNDRRDLIAHPEQAVRASDIVAMGLIEEILHYVLLLYREQKNPRAFSEAVRFLEEQVSGTDAAYRGYLAEFPPTELYRGQVEEGEYLDGQTDGEPHRAILLEELLMLWLDNVNPAFRRYAVLFDDGELEKRTAYRRMVHRLRDFFDTQEPFGPENQNLIDLLRLPALLAPDSLAGQLEVMRRMWGGLLGRYLLRILSSLDFIREEEKLAFTGPGPSLVYEFSLLENEPESFSPDQDWMPRLVMIAKSTLVWMDQLSRRYGRAIRRLDEIPDEELDRLAGWGFTGLWLIGIWERSRASRRIKQLTGNPEAAPSAYSLFDYTVSGELGGEEAYRALKDRCRQRGLRLACDMVPNHTGIDSRWVREHPDWYIQLPYSPFPSYTFGGPNLSEEPNVGVYLEDHYYNRTDAAVVFRRTDLRSGETRYIYHGNDGTHMPWNDTAQLNYLKPEVREAAVRTILHVARLFPVIRFDAAMTLTHRHYQRLWFPEPGTGGDIPTRSEHGMSREEFRRQVPQEFWREVVDRVAAEAPDTLLLAEAFWLMEGYFVRSLGMHRVYNSAFMNMLKREENAKYRQLIKNTLEFDPEILRRYANFMNNPDEETAVAQFGKGDKYFGVCLMMVTMPGLPMFGHGQIEGFTEKYGMEYTRAYWTEEPDRDLVARHEREIFPLMRRRYLFAGVEHFRQYDFFTREGRVNEDVFAYSNRWGSERALVLYNNRYEPAAGWVRTSAAFLDKAGGRGLRQESLAEGLALRREAGRFTLFRDSARGLEYIRGNRELAEGGLYVELAGFGSHVFLGFQEVADDERGHWRELHDSLGGRGVPDLRQELKRILLRPVLDGFARTLSRENLDRLLARLALRRRDDRLAAEVAARAMDFLQAARGQVGGKGDAGSVSRGIERGLEALLCLVEQTAPPRREGREAGPAAGRHGRRRPAGSSLDGEAARPLFPAGLPAEDALAFLRGRRERGPVLIGLLFSLVVLRPLGGLAAGSEEGGAGSAPAPGRDAGAPRFARDAGAGAEREPDRASPSGEMPGTAERSRSLIDELLLGPGLSAFLQGTGMDEWEAEEATLLLKGLVGRRDWFDAPAPRLERLVRDPDLQRFLKINRHEQTLWFNREALVSLLAWLRIVTRMDLAAGGLDPENPVFRTGAERLDLLDRWKEALEKSEYRLERLLEDAG